MAAFFTELFRIKPDEAETLLNSDLDREAIPSLWVRSMGDLELVGLWESLPNGESEGTLLAEPLSDLDADQIVTKLPDGFAYCISALHDEEVDEVAEQWSKMEELKHWDLPDLIQVVRDIQILVRDAEANGEIVVQFFEV